MRKQKLKSQPESADYRCEKKFFIEGMSAEQVIVVLKSHPAMLRELYPMRFVNNIYLDSPLLSDYYSNVNGFNRRQKVRVRWYHDMLRYVDDAVLEFKIKEGDVGTKEQFSFPEFLMDTSLTERSFRDLIEESDLPPAVKCRLRDLEFAILNRYRRWYFATPDKRFRFTVDSDLNFYHLGKISNRLTHSHTDHHCLVLELKYQVDDDTHAHRICAALPFRITRSSKYIRGMDSIYL